MRNEKESVIKLFKRNDSEMSEAQELEALKKTLHDKQQVLDAKQRAIAEMENKIKHKNESNQQVSKKLDQKYMLLDEWERELLEKSRELDKNAIDQSVSDTDYIGTLIEKYCSPDFSTLSDEAKDEVISSARYFITNLLTEYSEK